MYKHLFKLFPFGIKGKVLGISGIDNFNKIIKSPNQIVNVDFPEYDMQKLPFKSGSFDCVISDQVIEHLGDPKKAVDESYRVLKRGGIAIHTTCLLMPIHPCPNDYWRFTNDGLLILCSKFSKVINSGMWGNKLAVVLPILWNKLRYLPIFDNRFYPFYWLAMYNNPKYPIVSWIVVKK